MAIAAPLAASLEKAIALHNVLRDENLLRMEEGGGSPFTQPNERNGAQTNVNILHEQILTVQKGNESHSAESSSATQPAPKPPAPIPFSLSTLDTIWNGRESLNSIAGVRYDEMINRLVRTLEGSATVLETGLQPSTSSPLSLDILENQLRIAYRAGMLIGYIIVTTGSPTVDDIFSSSEASKVKNVAQTLHSIGTNLLLPNTKSIGVGSSEEAVNPLKLSRVQNVLQLAIAQLWDIIVLTTFLDTNEILSFFTARENQCPSPMYLASFCMVLRSAYLHVLLSLIGSILSSPRSPTALDSAVDIFHRFVLCVGPMHRWKGNQHSVRHAWVATLTDIINPTAPGSVVRLFRHHKDFSESVQRIILQRLSDRSSRASIVDVAVLSVLDKSAYLEVLEQLSQEDSVALLNSSFAMEMYRVPKDAALPTEITPDDILFGLKLVLCVGMISIVFDDGTAYPAKVGSIPLPSQSARRLHAKAKRYSRGLEMPCQSASNELSTFLLDAVLYGFLHSHLSWETLADLSRSIPPATIICAAVTYYPPLIIALRANHTAIASRVVDEMRSMCSKIFALFVDDANPSAAKDDRDRHLRKISSVMLTVGLPLLGDVVGNDEYASDVPCPPSYLSNVGGVLDCMAMLVALPTPQPSTNKLKLFEPLVQSSIRALNQGGVNNEIENWLVCNTTGDDVWDQHGAGDNEATRLRKAQRLLVPLLVMSYKQTVQSANVLALLDTWIPATIELMTRLSRSPGAELLLSMAHDALIAPIKHRSPIAALILPTYANLFAPKGSSSPLATSLLQHFAAHIRPMMQSLEECYGGSMANVLSADMAVREFYLKTSGGDEAALALVADLTVLKGELLIVQSIYEKLSSLLDDRSRDLKQRSKSSPERTQLISIYMNSLLFLLLVRDQRVLARVCASIELVLFKHLASHPKEQDFWMNKVELIVAKSPEETSKANLVLWWMKIGNKLAASRNSKL